MVREDVRKGSKFTVSHLLRLQRERSVVAADEDPAPNPVAWQLHPTACTPPIGVVAVEDRLEWRIDNAEFLLRFAFGAPLVRFAFNNHPASAKVEQTRVHILGLGPPLHEQSISLVENENRAGPVKETIRAHDAARHDGAGLVVPVDDDDSFFDAQSLLCVESPPGGPDSSPSRLRSTANAPRATKPPAISPNKCPSQEI